MSRRAPLLYSSDGNTPLVEDDHEDKLRALCIAAFGALKGLARGPRGPMMVEDHDLERYREHVAGKILEVLGPEPVEGYFGVKLQVTRTPVPAQEAE